MFSKFENPSNGLLSCVLNEAAIVWKRSGSTVVWWEQQYHDP